MSGRVQSVERAIDVLMTLVHAPKTLTEHARVRAEDVLRVTQRLRSDQVHTVQLAHVDSFGTPRSS